MQSTSSARTRVKFWAPALLTVLLLVAQWLPDTQVDAVTIEATHPGGVAMGGAWTWVPEDLQAADLDRIAASGAGWIRVSFRWSAMQPQRDQYDWSVMDRIVRLAAERDLKMLANVAYTPRWARPPDCDHPHCAPASPDTYAAFVETAVTRYSSHGVRAWEIWNEPNLATFWRPAADPAGYASVLRAAFAAAKRADPAVTVVSGGLAPRALDTSANLTPATFLRRLYAAGGSASLDAVGIHPYSYPRAPLDPHPTNTFAQLPDLHAQMAAAGDGDKQLWATEFGWWTSPLGAVHWGGSVTEEQQAEYLAEAYRAASSHAWMGPVFWFSLRDTGEGETADLQRDRNFGLIGEDGAPKPALAAFDRAMSRDDDLPVPTRTTISVAVRKATERLRFTTRLRGAAGRRVAVRLTLFRATPSGWHALRTRTGTVNAEGVERMRLRRPARGRCRVRVVFPGTPALRSSRVTDRFRC